jgi:GH18 family chitinase
MGHLIPTMCECTSHLVRPQWMSLRHPLSAHRNKRELISYDTARIAAAKARYIAQSGLGGAMFWELSLDQRAGPRGHEALVPLVAQQMGGLEWRENELDYMESSE